jgi:hypothetical protein
MVGKGVRPQFEFLTATVRELTGELPPDVVRRCAASVVSQCLFYFHARPVVNRLFPDLVFDAKEIETLTDHITGFALAGLAAIARGHQLGATAKSKAKPKPKPKPRTSGKAKP